ncbi:MULTISPECIES: lysophospholipid acyltransferase family protein [unclassified Leclercia]|uniref:L-ornithine N(alpha)-acyltransferase n=1 Tax=Leclercia barmai TaxID=2785629 RepID=A0ABS7RVL3_9ENTR|nr:MULTISPECIES: GNAT family N-acyltransferase [unclassified Leclercia]MBZ0058347.1 lysophospholipid acyltransferase family protein [Leclercia sp. EMC7]MCM5697774.1 lysophospholipid acyltransferase family protein [Leclercia sp. LTM01]MCM5700905.1 lysophospholipid acyltransferase family protein [Leclercia sp. LTM14]
MFSLDSVLDDLWPQAKPAPWQKSLLKKLLHEEEFQQFAADHRHLKGLDMVEQVLEHLDILCAIPAHDLEQIPAHGPLIVIANHPTGTLDGLALLYAISRVRRDVKVVTNRMLSHLEPLSSLFIPVDNMGGRTAKSSFTLMEQHLQNAGVLIFFPAGEVSRPTRTGIRDKKWHPGFIKLAGKFRAPLLPVNIHARNSLLFYASTLLSPQLSMLLLMQQMFRRRHCRLPVKIGQQIGWSHWYSPTLSAREMAEQCRQHVLRLGKGLSGVFKTESAIARPEDRATLKRALTQAECLGTTADGKTIYLWQRNGQEEAPILRELGRLREIAFRAVGEGSGKRRDTDRYDDDYLHLILWDDEDLEIVGAYRFMPGALKGREALYSHSLFHYDDEMQAILDHGIELGRSFIQPRYWGRRGLDYLWSGIGAYLARYPHYRYLFGPVSISGGLPPAARDLLVAFYRLWFPATHPLATSRRPYPASLPDVLAQFGGEDYVEDLTRLKSLLGNLGCGIPPLYKQYSELCEPGGVQFIDFGSDPAFNNCIDGLVLVDLCYLKASRYQRYIGAHL